MKEWNRPRRGLISVDFLELAATHGSDYAESIYPPLRRGVPIPLPETLTDDDDSDALLHEPSGPVSERGLPLDADAASGSDDEVPEPPLREPVPEGGHAGARRELPSARRRPRLSADDRE